MQRKTKLTYKMTKADIVNEIHRATGYDKAAIPSRYAGVRHCEKALELSMVTDALFG